MRVWNSFFCSFLLLFSPVVVTGRAILGVDLGSLYMKVALVQSGSPLEIVTNLHSKRKTEQMILFDREQRFYGADASALLARKSQKTPEAMSLLLGRDDQHPVVRVSRIICIISWNGFATTQKALKTRYFPSLLSSLSCVC